MNKSLFEKYLEDEKNQYHHSGDIILDVFADACSMQFIRIQDNLKKAFPDKTDREITDLMLYGEER